MRLPLQRRAVVPTLSSSLLLLLLLPLAAERAAGFLVAGPRRTPPKNDDAVVVIIPSSRRRRRSFRRLSAVSSFDDAAAVTTASSSMTIDVAPEAPRDLRTFQDWAVECGIQSAEGFELTSSSSGSSTGSTFGGMRHESDDDDDKIDVSAATTQDLPAGTTVLYVPQQVILSSRSAMQEFGRLDAVEDILGSANMEEEHVQRFYLFLKVLKEYQAGEKSPWYPWLNSLPRYHANGASMTANCFDCLPPLVSSLAKAEAILAYQFFVALGQVDFLRDDIRNDKQVAKWAFSIAYTRGFPTPTTTPDDGVDFRIVPMGDMLNHATYAQVEMFHDDEGNAYAVTNSDVPAGSPLCLLYGDPTNPSHLLARYGFLDATSPASFCKIMIDDPSEELVNMGYDHSKMLFFKDTGDVSEEVWDVLLYRNLGSSDPDTQQALYQAHMTGDVETKAAIHQHFFAETLASLQYHVESFLRELDELQAKAASLDPNDHPRAPVIMAHNAFVRETFLKVRAKLSEYAQ